MTKQITQKQLQAAQLLERSLQGDLRAQAELLEGISTSDIPVQLNPVTQAFALNGYAEQETIWRSFAGRETLPDFGTQEYYSFVGWDDDDVEASTAGDTFVHDGLPTVPEYGEYSRLRFAAAGQNLKLKKKGVAVQFSWESLRSTRNFGLIQRAFTEFGRRSAIAEDHEATKQLLSTTNFASGNGNLDPTDAALSLPALENAFNFIGTQTYNGNRVVPATKYALVVPPALEFTAKQILNITQVNTTETVGGVETIYQTTGNPVAGRLSLVVNPYIPLLAGGTDTNWWLVPVPGSTPNPGIVNLFLQGYETPSIFVKRTTNSAPEEGDFIDDSYETKVRHVVTGGFIRPEGTYKNDGE